MKHPIIGRLILLALLPLCLLASVLAAIRMAFAIVANPHRAFLLAQSHDQLGNTACNGNMDETISSRAYRAMQEGKKWGCVLCRVLDWIDQDHCRKAQGH